jgi:hypothetical protein
METLRTELVETQKVRSDLLKWKLLIVAGISGAALGLSKSGSGSAAPNAHFALAVIPIACVYVDLLCRHLSLRNKAIGLFIGFHVHNDKTLRDYEQFYLHLSKKAWAGVSFESVALVGCTIFLSLMIVPIGILASGLSLWPIPIQWPANLFIGSGTVGVLLSIWLQVKYSKAKSMAEQLSSKENSELHSPSETAQPLYGRGSQEKINPP